MPRILFAGTPEFAVPALTALLRGGHDVVGVCREQSVDKLSEWRDQIEVVPGRRGKPWVGPDFGSSPQRFRNHPPGN